MRLLRNACVGMLALTGAFLQAQSTATTSFPAPVNVGQQSSPVTVTVTMTASGTAGSTTAVTQGSAAMDFSVTGGTCSAGSNYLIGQFCTASVVFSPKYPGVRSGAVNVTSTNGSVLGTALLSGIGKGGLGVLNPGNFDIVAGSSAWLYRGDGMVATQAQIFLPMAVVADAVGNLYISDSNNNRIRRVDAATQIISTVAGNGTPGYSGDGGLATQAMISSPSGLALDGAGNLYFVDSGNEVVRRIDASTGVVTTVAGQPTRQGYAGDGGSATSATLSLPEGLAFNAAGDMYIADTGNNVVRVVSASTRIITTVAGTGQPGFNGDNQAAASAMLNSPWGIAIGPDGSLYIADLNNHRIRKVSGSIITTVVGTGVQGLSADDTLATAAKVNSPAGVALDPAGDIYVADSGNNIVRKVYASTGKIKTLINDQSKGAALYNPANLPYGPGWPALINGQYGPYGIFVNQTGDLFVSDLFQNNVIRVSAGNVHLRYATIKVSKTSPPQPMALDNGGNAALNVSSLPMTNAALDAATTTCTSTSVVVAGSSCNFGVEFAPKVVGSDVQGSLTANSDASNTPALITLSGQVLDVNPTTVSLTSNNNPSFTGDSVTFTATVTSDDPARSGTVDFLDGANTICSAVTLNTNGIATCTTNTLTLGQHIITANYSGDNNNASSSASLTQVVQQNATLALIASPNPAMVTQNVTLTLQASAVSGVPTGTIIFYDGTTALSSVALDGSGKATFSTTTLIPGAHSLTAKYSGDATNAAGISNTVSEQVNRADTVTTLSTSNANVPVGTTVVFNANVSSSNGPAPTGTVTFTDGAKSLGTINLLSNGTAVLTTSALAPGAHSITATYSGDTDDSGSSSSGLTETINQLGTTTTLASDSNPSNAGALIHLTAAVSIAAGSTPSGTITGTVTFMDGTKTLGSANVDASGNAVLPVSGLAVGSHALIATYSGNTNYATSTSAGLSQQVNTTSTTTVLSSSNQSSLSGKAVTLSATVTSVTGGIPTGTITFTEGGVVIGTGTLNASGVATFTTSTLSVASHSIVASYTGDSNYQSSASSPYIQVVSLATTSLTLAGPSAPVNAGLQVSMLAGLTSNGVAPTGSIVLKDGGTVIGTQNVTNTGTFTFDMTTLAVGVHTLTATYGGDSNSAAATSNAITVTIQQGATTTALTSSLNPAIVGQNVTFTATVTSVSPSITGSINFMDGANVLGSVAVANGVATLSTNTLPYGPHTITAVYSGDANHVTSTSAVLNQSIVQAASAALISSLNPSVSGNNVVFTAKITGVGSLVPTGKATFTDGGATLGVVALDGTGSATYATSTLSVASHNIGLSYGGDTNYSTANTSLIQTVGNANTAIDLTSSANPATYGTPLNLTAIVHSNGGAATGKIVFTEGTATVGSAVLDATGTAVLTTSTLAPGAHSIVANYGGDGKASASVSTPLTIIVKQLTSVTVLSSSNPAATLSSVTFTAFVKNAGATQPTGTVTFVDGTTNLGTVALDATGHASVTVPSMTAGTHPVTVSYIGDDADFTSVSAVLQQVVSLRPTTTALSSTLTDANNPNNVTLIGIVHWEGTATNPSGKITFTTGNQTIGSAVIDSTGVATLNITLDVPSESVVATYSGDTSYATSSSIATTVSQGTATQFKMSVDPPNITLVSKQRQTVNLTLTSVKSYTDMMQFGCLGLPYAATCTFSKTADTLAANGTMTVQVTVDTGSPLGEGVKVSSNSTPASHGNGIALAFLPVGLLVGFAMFRKNKRGVPALLLALFALAATMGMTGCSGLTGSGTPAGSYAIKITAAGKGTGVTQAVVLNMTVTQ